MSRNRSGSGRYSHRPPRNFGYNQSQGQGHGYGPPLQQQRAQQQSPNQIVPQNDDDDNTNYYEHSRNRSSNRGRYTQQLTENQSNARGQKINYDKTNKSSSNLLQTNLKQSSDQKSEETAQMWLKCEADEQIFCRECELESFYKSMDESEELTLIENLFKTESWSTDELTDLKNKLNQVRAPHYAKASDVWHKFRNRIRTTTTIKPKLISDYDIEMCNNSWVKITELFYKYSEFLIPSNLSGKPVPIFRTLHLCEAPGSFICATNQYIRQKYKSRIDWSWTAMTLNPYNESISMDTASFDDRFLIETIEHWYFGVDDTGNILNPNNIEGLWQKYPNENDKVHLITADGSFTAMDKETQEDNLNPLLYAEILTALGALHINGSFLVQLFSIFECHTVCLLYLLAICFETIFITKPAGSLADSAEKYVVCKGFQGISQKILNKLLQHVNTPSMTAIFPRSFIPETFLEEILKCSKFFAEKQIQATERNRYLLENCSEDGEIRSRPLSNQLKELKQQINKKYFESSPLNRMDNKNHRIVKTVHLTDSDKEVGNSFFAWQNFCRNEHPLVPRIIRWPADSNTGIPTIEDEPFFDSIEPSPESNNFNENSIVFAKKFTRILTSLVADAFYIKALYELRDEVYQKNNNSLIFQINSKKIFLSECYAELGLTNFCYTRTAVELQSLDRYLNVVNSFQPLSSTDPLLFVILPSPSNSEENLGYAEYIAWQQSGLVHGLVFTTADGNSQIETPYSTIQCCRPEENIEQMFKNTFTTEEQSRIQLIIGDLSVQYDDLMRTPISEKIYKYKFTQTCRNTLQLLSRHGHFICKISDMFTRFTIGLIYILYMSFEKITILKPFTLNPALPDRFVVCQNFLGCNNLYIEHLNSCLKHMQKLQNTENEIVQIIPMTCFKKAAFINYIREQTQSLTKRECEALKKLLWSIETPNTSNIIDRIDGAAQRIKTAQRIV